MIAGFKEKATSTLVRLVGSTCLLMGGALVLATLLVILTPLLLGLALLAMAGKANLAQARDARSSPLSVDGSVVSAR